MCSNVAGFIYINEIDMQRLESQLSYLGTILNRFLEETLGSDKFVKSAPNSVHLLILISHVLSRLTRSATLAMHCRKKVTYMAPCPGPLPSQLLLAGSLAWTE